MVDEVEVVEEYDESFGIPSKDEISSISLNGFKAFSSVSAVCCNVC